MFWKAVARFSCHLIKSFMRKNTCQCSSVRAKLMECCYSLRNFCERIYWAKDAVEEEEFWLFLLSCHSRTNPLHIFSCFFLTLPPDFRSLGVINKWIGRSSIPNCTFPFPMKSRTNAQWKPHSWAWENFTSYSFFFPVLIDPAVWCVQFLSITLLMPSRCFHGLAGQKYY